MAAKIKIRIAPKPVWKRSKGQLMVGNRSFDPPNGTAMFIDFE